MTKLGYLWIFLSVGVALFTVAHESGARDGAIRDATRGALYTGVYAGCNRDNDLRNEMLTTARKLHPAEADLIQQSIRPAPCQQLAEELVETYLHSSR